MKMFFDFFTDKTIPINYETLKFNISIPKSKRIEKVIKDRELSGNEIQKTKKLFSIIGTPKYILDIGANLGYKAIHYHLASPTSAIYSFEPSKFNWKYFKKNTKQFSKINGNNIGLSDQIESRFLSMPGINQNTRVSKMKENTGLLSLYGDSGSKKEEVNLDTLDNWLLTNNIVLENSFIKIDVEGHELSVLKGAKNTLSRKNTLWIEFNPDAFKLSNTTPDALIKYLAEFGYHPFEFDGINCIAYNNPTLNKVIDVLFKKDS
jgi:FkbM family methyltransferase